jgi:hypothetical protein
VDGRVWTEALQSKGRFQYEAKASSIARDAAITADHRSLATPQAPRFPIVTALGDDTLVIAEPGVGPKGNLGLWLTVLVLKKDVLVETSRYFHAFHNGRIASTTTTKTLPSKNPTKKAKRK